MWMNVIWELTVVMRTLNAVTLKVLSSVDVSQVMKETERLVHNVHHPVCVPGPPSRV